MSNIAQFATAAGEAASAGAVIGGLLWWTFRRGVAEGIRTAREREQERVQAKTQAKIEAIEQVISELRTDQGKHRRF